MKFFKLVDDSGTLSLTSLALWVVLVKIAIAPSIGITEAGGLFVALLSYQGKKLINQQTPAEPNAIDTQVEEMKQKLLDVESKVSALSLSSGLKR